MKKKFLWTSLVIIVGLTTLSTIILAGILSANPFPNIPKDVQKYYDNTWVYVGKGKFKQADREMKKLLTKFPRKEFKELWDNIAEIIQKNPDCNKQALKYFIIAERNFYYHKKYNWAVPGRDLLSVQILRMKDPLYEGYEKIVDEFPNCSLADDALLRQGQLEWNVYEKDKSIALWQQILDKYPDSDKADDALYLIAKRHAGYGKTDTKKAIATFKKFLQQYPNSDKTDDVLFAWANLYINSVRWPGVGRLQTPPEWAFKMTVKRLNELLDKYPEGDKADDALLMLGDLYLYDKLKLFRDTKIKLAIPKYEQLIENYPHGDKVSTAWFNIGEAYYRLRKYDMAIKAYQKAATPPLYKPDLAVSKTLYRLGEIYTRFNKPDQALECYDKLLKDHPFPPHHYCSALRSYGDRLNESVKEFLKQHKTKETQ